ncbi:hypothetical protein SAMN06295998_11151 [Primorskyibacter flagellatus]|uniref:Uncharacterized protein n=1 Tax=Primorskyibacter flagellatus TaxID=1387277 RepID=A0A1W2D7B2_9RHOB|nr:hypothetical protein SAMN06295998_11151 [Primorskyibacter flagellatus]
MFQVASWLIVLAGAVRCREFRDTERLTGWSIGCAATRIWSEPDHSFSVTERSRRVMLALRFKQLTREISK